MLDLHDLEDALMFVSGAGGAENAAYVERATGTIHWVSGDELEMLDAPPLPDDLDDEEKYVPVPTERELDLGQRLVFRFVQEVVPDQYDEVRAIFSRKGAYGRYDDWLDRRDLLEKWRAYYNHAVHTALREWCKENALTLQP